jgi:hypothetical protein
MHGLLNSACKKFSVFWNPYADAGCPIYSISHQPTSVDRPPVAWSKSSLAFGPILADSRTTLHSLLGLGMCPNSLRCRNHSGKNHYSPQREVTCCTSENVEVYEHVRSCEALGKVKVLEEEYFLS